MPWQLALMLFQHPPIALHEKIALHRVGRAADTVVEAVTPRGVMVERVFAQPLDKCAIGIRIGRVPESAIPDRARLHRDQPRQEVAARIDEKVLFAEDGWPLAQALTIIVADEGAIAVHNLAE